MWSRLIAAGLFGAALSAAACAGSTTSEPSSAGPGGSSVTTVLSLAPAASATSVDPNAPIRIVFTHPMMLGMEALVVLHKSSVTGAAVAGTAAWSSDRTTLTFTPAQPLEPKTTYVLHLSPNLKDANGNPIDFASCAQRLGGQAPVGSVLGGMMGGGMGPGMMGSGWQMGSGQWGYGMVFTFTTA